MCHTKEIKQFARPIWNNLLRQPLRPKLSRKIVRSAKVNLNRYWTRFEEMTSNAVPPTTAEPPPETTDNEINDNLINEYREDINKQE